jgi:hypothetical protein
LYYCKIAPFTIGDNTICGDYLLLVIHLYLSLCTNLTGEAELPETAARYGRWDSHPRKLIELIIKPI